MSRSVWRCRLLWKSIIMNRSVKENDFEIVGAILSKDERVTRQFFFKDCYPLFVSIIKKVFSYNVDYDEFVNEFYLYLMEDDAKRLRQYQGLSSIFQWMKVVAIRYFIAKKKQMIDMQNSDPLIEKIQQSKPCHRESDMQAKIDMRTLLKRMPNKRFAYVIEQLIINDVEPVKLALELGITVDNLYNIKKRAIAQMTKIVLNEVCRYEK